MQGNLLMLIPTLLPIVAAPLAYGLGRKKQNHGIAVMVAATAVSLAVLVALLIGAGSGSFASLTSDGVCSLGFALRADGFRALYATIAGFMWVCTSIFSFDYFAHEENVARYCFFTLLTFGATVGVLLSDTLYTTFLFFEVMSLASYPWVAQEETKPAMRAAETYLYIAVIGGLVMLMGLFLLPSGLATTRFDELTAAAASVDKTALWLPCVLILFGFGAKAGAFPLHIWLPKAHPVAPSPASALLSGMLTKAGVFGMLVLGCKLMMHDAQWGKLIFWLGVVTMVLGALLALLSVNLKRTLACSSLSQIGFIMVGVGLLGMLGEENGLAAYGTVEHMVNHSMFKLLLFMCAGVVVMNAHSLTLDDIRGFGRKKPLLNLAFLSGLLGIAGVPLFSGFASKSLLHEGILEYVALLNESGASSTIYTVAEWLFLISGGMTLAYMLKLYVCVFWQRNPTRQAEFDGMKHYVSPATAAVLVVCALIPPLLGCLPNVFMDGIGGLSQGFLNANLEHAVHYFSVENLVGACKSLVIGVALYFFVVRTLLSRRTSDGYHVYPDVKPAWLDLEDSVYRPLMALLASVGYFAASLMDRAVDGTIALLRTVGAAFGRALDTLPESTIVASIKTVFKPTHRHAPVPVGNRFTFAVGRFLDGCVSLLNRTLRRSHPIETRFVITLAAGNEELDRQTRRLTRSISFGLLMFCLGLFATLAYLVLL